MKTIVQHNLTKQARKHKVTDPIMLTGEGDKFIEPKRVAEVLANNKQSLGLAYRLVHVDDSRLEGCPKMLETKYELIKYAQSNPNFKKSVGLVA